MFQLFFIELEEGKELFGHDFFLFVTGGLAFPFPDHSLKVQQELGSVWVCVAFVIIHEVWVQVLQQILVEISAAHKPTGVVFHYLWGLVLSTLLSVFFAFENQFIQEGFLFLESRQVLNDVSLVLEQLEHLDIGLQG